MTILQSTTSKSLFLARDHAPLRTSKHAGRGTTENSTVKPLLSVLSYCSQRAGRMHLWGALVLHPRKSTAFLTPPFPLIIACWGLGKVSSIGRHEHGKTSYFQDGGVWSLFAAGAILQAQRPLSILDSAPLSWVGDGRRYDRRRALLQLAPTTSLLRPGRPDSPNMLLPLASIIEQPAALFPQKFSPTCPPASSFITHRLIPNRGSIPPFSTTRHSSPLKLGAQGRKTFSVSISVLKH